MAVRRIVSLVAIALVAIINPTFIVDAQIIPGFPGGSLDVGGVPTLPGKHSGSGGDWSLSGSVGDIWGGSDRFRYVYSNYTGDVTVTCKVKSFTAGGTWKKGGIMFRSNLTPQSKHSTIMVTGWGIAQQSRLAEWGGSESKHDGFQNTNVWLRLVKKGNTVTSYYKYDGDVGYMRYHSVTIDLGPSYFLGLCVTMNDSLVLGTLVVSDFAISKDVEWMNVPIKIGNSASAAEEFPDGSVNVGGVPALPGSQLGSGGDWSLSGSVGDIWGGSDKFYYVYADHTGDITITCKVKSFTSGGAWKKGGIMFRSSLSDKSKHSMIQVTGWGIAHQSRLVDGSGSLSQHDGFQNTNVWLRLVKKGNTVTSYYRKDGEYGYMRYHSVNIDLGPSYFVGLGVTMNDAALLGTLVVSDFAISTDVETYSFPNVPIKIGESATNSADNLVRVQEVGEGVWSIYTGGVGIGGTSDSFGFFYKESTGNVNATLHFHKMVVKNQQTRGGLMIRASQSANSAFVGLLIDPYRGVTMYSRSESGGTTAGKNLGLMREDAVLRLVKTGSNVLCQYKQIGAPDWVELGTATANFGDSFLVGQALASGEVGNHAQLTTGNLIIE